MGPEFLARVRRSSLIAGLVAALAVATVSIVPGVAFAAGLAWSLLNLRALQGIVFAMTDGTRGTARALGRAGLWAAAALGLFALGAFLLVKLPPVALAAGFGFPFVVITLKAVSLALLESALWRRVTASRWQAALIVLALAGAAWFASNHFAVTLRANASPALAAPAAPHPQHADHVEHVEHKDSAAPAEKKDAGPRVFPNLVGLIAEGAIRGAEERGAPPPAWAHALEHFEVIVYSMLVALLISIVAIHVASRWQMVPGPLQALVETWVERAYNFFTGILGPKYGPRFVPFLGTLFVYIYIMNIFGLIPFMHSPTSSLNVTVAMALTVFVYVQFTAFRELGPLGWLDHMAGSPRDLVGWLLVPLMLPVHVIGELAKPISLSCRLFGNIFGEDMLLVGFATLGVTSLSALHVPFGLPLHVPFMFLAGIITSPVQALVFTMLSTIYFLLMLPHDHGHEAHEAEAHHAH